MGTSTDRLKLDEQLCFALYAASRAMTARYRPYLDAVGLTYPQFLVLIVLWDDGPSTVSQIGERLRLDSGTLSPLLKRLESAGLTTRSRVPHDERSVLIDLSPEGNRLRKEADRVLGEIAGSLADFDHAELTRPLQGLEARLRADT